MKFLSVRNIPVASLQPVFDQQNKEMEMGPMPMGGSKDKDGTAMDPGLQAVIQKAQDGIRDRGLMH